MIANTCSFAEQGYATLPLFAPATVRAAEADITELVDRVSNALYWPFGQSLFAVSLGERIDQIWQAERSQAALLRTAICTDAHHGPRLDALARSPELHAAAEKLTGRRIDGTVVRVRANIGVFPEHRHDWHSDVALSDGTDCARVGVTAWIPLSDTGPNAGGIELVPGRRTAPLPHEQDLCYRIPEALLADEPRLAPECTAGTVLFLDRFTPHRTLPAGPQARFALVVWMKFALENAPC